MLLLVNNDIEYLYSSILYSGKLCLTAQDVIRSGTHYLTPCTWYININATVLSVNYDIEYWYSSIHTLVNSV